MQGRGLGYARSPGCSFRRLALRHRQKLNTGQLSRRIAAQCFGKGLLGKLAGVTMQGAAYLIPDRGFRLQAACSLGTHG